MGTVKINFEGMELEVPEESVGSVVLQLKNLRAASAPSAPSGSQPAAPTTSAKTTTLNPQAAWPFPVKGMRGESTDSRPSESTGLAVDAKLALRFLEAIYEGEEWDTPAGADNIGRVLGVKHAKGIGSKTAMINRTLYAMGFAPEDVYHNPRDSTGARHWRAGSALEKAMLVLRKEAKS